MPSFSFPRVLWFFLVTTVVVVAVPTIAGQAPLLHQHYLPAQTLSLDAACRLDSDIQRRTMSGVDIDGGGGGVPQPTPPATRTTHASGLECVTLRHPSGAEATLTLHGANVIEWKSAGNDSNLLFVSDSAVFDGKKAIRGGIPLVFPQFGAGLGGSCLLYTSPSPRDRG